MCAVQDDSDSRRRDAEEPFETAPATGPEQGDDEWLDSRPLDGDETAAEEAGYGYGV